MTTLNPFFTEEHRQFQESVQAFVKKEAPIEKVRQWDRNKEYPYELFEKMADLGWFGIGIPTEYGGNNLDVIYMTIIAEELGRWSSDLGGGYSLNMWGGLNIVKWGTDAQKRAYIQDFLTAKRRFTFSMTEPNAGSDSFSLITSAVEDGDNYVINGEKIFSTAADKKNNVIMLAARTRKSDDKRDGISVFLVPNDTPGIEIHRLDTLARRILGTNRIFFTDVRIPKTALLGPLHKGIDVLRWHLEIERITSAAGYMGNGQGALDLALRYAKDRVQFGRPIGSFQAIAHMLADMHAEVEASRLLVYRAAWLRAQNLPCFREASVAKLHASEMSFKVASQGMQILGGYAQIPDFDMERIFRDSKQSMVGAGTNQIQRSIIARELGVRA